MKPSKICLATLLSLGCLLDTTNGQEGPLWFDHLFPRAWENPVKDLPPDIVVSPYNPSDVINQLNYVPTVSQLAQGHKEYYVFPSPERVNGKKVITYFSPKWYNVYLEWGPPEFPNDPPYHFPDFGTDYIALDFALYNQECFQSLSGPYGYLPDSPVFVGVYEGYAIIAWGPGRILGKAFTQHQIDKIKETNSHHNDGSLKSDLRAELVSEFLGLNPGIDPDDIPVDSSFSAATAVVAHIIPALAPRDPNSDPETDTTSPCGHGCGRNSYKNAVLVSQSVSDILSKGMPAPGLVQFVEFLATQYAPKAGNPLPSPARFQYRAIRDLNELRGLDVEYLDENDTRSLIEYGRLAVEAVPRMPIPDPRADQPKR